MFGEQRRKFLFKSLDLIVRVDARLTAESIGNLHEQFAATVQRGNRILESGFIEIVYDRLNFCRLFLHAFQESRFVMFYFDLFKRRDSERCRVLGKERIHGGSISSIALL